MPSTRGWLARRPMLLLLLFLFLTAPCSLHLARCAAGQPISAVVGTAGTAGVTPDGGLAVDALLNQPYGVAVDWRSGDLFVSDTSNNRIRRVASTNGLIHPFAGTGTPGYAGDGGPATSALLNFPQALFITPAGLVYFTDTNNHAIRLVSLDGLMHTVAGTGTQGDGDSGIATQVALNSPSGVSVTRLNGDVIFCDTLNHKVRRVTADGTITTLAGSGYMAFTGDGGPATAAQLNSPFGIAVDPTGVIFIADRNNCRVRWISLDGIIDTAVGSFTSSARSGINTVKYCFDLQPAGLALDLTGHLYVADEDCTVRVMDTVTYALTTLAGNLSTCGFNGNDRPALTALLNSVFNVALGPMGDVYVADTYNNAVRRIAADTASPPSPPVSSSASTPVPALPVLLPRLPPPSLTPTPASTPPLPLPRPSFAPVPAALAAPAVHSVTGAVAGGVVGGVLALAVLLAGLLWRRRQQRGLHLAPDVDALVFAEDGAGGSGPLPSVFLVASSGMRMNSGQLLLTRRFSSLAPSSSAAAATDTAGVDAAFGRASADGSGRVDEVYLQQASAPAGLSSTLPPCAPTTPSGPSDSVEPSARASTSNNTLPTPRSYMSIQGLSATTSAGSSLGAGVRASTSSSEACVRRLTRSSSEAGGPTAVSSMRPSWADVAEPRMSPPLVPLVPVNDKLRRLSAYNSGALLSSKVRSPQPEPSHACDSYMSGPAASSWGVSTDMRLGVGVGIFAMPSHTPEASSSQLPSWANTSDLLPLVVSAVHALPNDLAPLRLSASTPTPAAASSPFTPAWRAAQDLAVLAQHDSPHHHEAAYELHARILRVADSPQAAAPAGSSRVPQGPATTLVGAAAKMNVGGVWWTQGALIDQGGNGRVYCGHDRDGALIAVKVQALPAGTDRFGQDLLLQELRALQKLKHRNVVEYLGSTMDDNNLYIFMSHEPQSLARLLKDGLDESIVRNYTRQILQGLEYVHSQGIWHRDIKAANLLIGADDIVRLTDFGSAKVQQPTDITSNVDTIAGTPHWMSPEICLAAVGRGQGQGYSGVKADVWSLGVTVVEMLMGGHPWCKMEGIQVIWQVVNNTDGLPRPKHASPMALDFLDLCLQRDPAKRSSIAQLLAHPFVAAQDNALLGGLRRLTSVPSAAGTSAPVGGRNQCSPSNATAQPRYSRMSAAVSYASPGGAVAPVYPAGCLKNVTPGASGAPPTTLSRPRRWS